MFYEFSLILWNDLFELEEFLKLKFFYLKISLNDVINGYGV